MKIKQVVFILILLSSVLYSQNNRFSVGLVGSQLHNYSSEDRLSKADNPNAYGVVFGFEVNESLSIAFTGEFGDTELEKLDGNEKNYRGHLSAYFTPLKLDRVVPYLSTGLVYSIRDIDYTSSGAVDKKENKIYARFGLGVDIPILSKIYANADLGGYSNELKFVGWSSSLGLRYIL